MAIEAEGSRPQEEPEQLHRILGEAIIPLNTVISIINRSPLLEAQKGSLIEEINIGGDEYAKKLRSEEEFEEELLDELEDLLGLGLPIDEKETRERVQRRGLILTTVEDMKLHRVNRVDMDNAVRAFMEGVLGRNVTDLSPSELRAFEQEVKRLEPEVEIDSTD